MRSLYLPGNDEEDIRDVLANLDGDSGLPWQELGGGLGCPNDSLDDVMDCLNSLHDGFLDELGMGSPPPPRPVAEDVDGEVKAAPLVLDVASAPAGVPEEEEDVDVVDMFLADGAPDDFGGVLGGGASSYNASWALPAAGPCDVAALGFAPLFPACGVLDVVPLDSAPPFPAHDVAATGWAPMFPSPDSSYGAALYFAEPLPPAWPVLDGVVAPDTAPLLPAAHDALACAVVPDTKPVHDAPACAIVPDTKPAHGALACAILVPDTKPAPLPAHDAVPPARPPTKSSTSSGCVSSMSLETESAPPVALSPLPATWPVVARRKRHLPVTRRNPRWLPKFQLGVAKPNKRGGGGTKKPAAARRRNRDRQRQCSHCSSKETPQWRAGPRGPGTLCNACGIRFKQNKGVLFEEYRPCTSPSFEDGMHSNRQRKVDKIRERKKEGLLRLVMAQTTVAPPPIVGGSEFVDVCT